jgi:hypothetical protein
MSGMSDYLNMTTMALCQTQRKYKIPRKQEREAKEAGYCKDHALIEKQQDFIVDPGDEEVIRRRSTT